MKPAPTQLNPTVEDTSSATDVSQIELARLNIPEHFQKVLRKLAVTIGQPKTVGELLTIDPESFRKFKAVGEVYLKLLKDLQLEIPAIATAALQAWSQTAPPPDLSSSSGRPSSLLLNSPVLSAQEIEQILIQDFEKLLMEVDARRRTIVLARWGFTVPAQKLEYLGRQFGVTRERVRQMEAKFNKSISRSLRIQPEALGALLTQHIEEDLSELFPELADLFTETRLFYRFLEVCSGLPEGQIQAVQHFERNGRDRKVLEEFWREMPSPVAPELLIAELMNECGYSNSQAQHAIDRFIRLEMLVPTTGGFVPRNLTQKAAVAHALIPHPKGLPWVDIARVVNALRLSGKPLPEDRLNQSIVNCESSYLCGRGSYRHLRYFPLSDGDAPGLLAMVRGRLVAHGQASANLPDLHRALAGECSCDYFELRHFVSAYGEEHGLYFDGTSSNDTVSLTPEGERVRIREVILKLLCESPRGLTLVEVASQLKTKSVPLARLYVGRLIDENKVVRVDEMIYTTPEKAFDQVDLNGIGQVMDAVIAEVSLPVEADVVRERANAELSLHYSKHLYMAIGRMSAERFGWYRKRTVFCRAPIPYKGLMDIVRAVCDPLASNEVNMDQLVRHIRVTPQTALLALARLRSAHRSIPEFEG